MNNPGQTNDLSNHIVIKKSVQDQVGNGTEVGGIGIDGKLNWNGYKELEELKRIENLLEGRRSDNGVVNKLREALRDRKRDTEFSPGHNILANFKSESLLAKGASLRSVIITAMRKLYENSLDTEHTLPLAELVAKYNVKSVIELLDLGEKLKANDLDLIRSHSQQVVKFRKRKIVEYVCYRYARSASINTSVVDFILNTSVLVESDLGADLRWTRGKINNRPVAVDIEDVGLYLKQLEIDAESIITKNKKDAQMEALKMYLIFLWIHPLDDGNGRTGRALFVFLQRKFGITSKDSLLHIPISRRESGTDTSNDAGTQLSLGSIASKIYAVERKIFDTLRRNEDYDLPYDKMRSLIDEEEVRSLIDELYKAIEESQYLDREFNGDWKPILSAAKEAIVESRTGDNKDNTGL